jgi:signal transduction histidine kinase
MLRRLRGVSEANWRVMDRLFVAVLIAVSAADLIWNDLREGPLAANLAVMTAISVSFLWRRSLPHVVAAITLGGLIVMAAWLTMPPDLFIAIVMLLTVAYSTGRHLEGRMSIVVALAGAAAITTIAAIYDPDDVIFPVIFFWVVPWLAGRTLRNQTSLARELAEKAERAQHAREEEERRAIVLERSRIARELHDVLAHNLSVMVVQASAAGRIVDKNPAQAAEVANLIQRTGREALAEIRHLFGAVRRGEGEALSGPPSIARVEELAQRARTAGLGVELRLHGDPVQLPAGIDLTAYRIVQEALTNALKHAGSARASVTVSYEPNEVVLSIEDDGEGPRDGYELSESGGGHGLVGMQERAALYGGRVQAGRRRGGGFAVHARLPTRPAVPGTEPATAVREVPA